MHAHLTLATLDRVPITTPEVPLACLGVVELQKQKFSLTLMYEDNTTNMRKQFARRSHIYNLCLESTYRLHV